MHDLTVINLPDYRKIRYLLLPSDVQNYTLFLRFLFEHLPPSFQTYIQTFSGLFCAILIFLFYHTPLFHILFHLILYLNYLKLIAFKFPKVLDQTETCDICDMHIVSVNCIIDIIIHKQYLSLTYQCAPFMLDCRNFETGELWTFFHAYILVLWHCLFSKLFQEFPVKFWLTNYKLANSTLYYVGVM